MPSGKRWAGAGGREFLLSEAVAQANLDAAPVVGGVGPPKEGRAKYAAYLGYVLVVEDVG